MAVDKDTSLGKTGVSAKYYPVQKFTGQKNMDTNDMKVEVELPLYLDKAQRDLTGGEPVMRGIPVVIPLTQEQWNDTLELWGVWDYIKNNDASPLKGATDNI